MKNILKIIILTFSIACLSSCENEKDPVLTTIPFELRSLEPTNPVVLMPQNSEDTVLTLEWDKSEVSIKTTEPKYIVEIAKANTNFENPVSVNNDEFISPDRSYVLKVGELNSLLFNNGFECSIAADIEIRVKSILGNREGNPFLQYSNSIKINVTPYSNELPQLVFAQNSAEISNSVKLSSSSITSNNDYEGYVYLQPGNYKFYKPDVCNSFTSPAIYGGAAGTIDANATAPSIVVATAGHYLIKANLAANTYSVREFTTFGIFGLATRPTLSLNQVPMTYDEPTKTWKLTVDLRKGYKFKFKSNLWTGALVVPALPNPPYAPGTATSFVSILGKTSVNGELVENAVSGSGDISVPGSVDDTTRQKYDIELNVSNPRKYTYKMILNPN